jgi:hypothetical protein
LKDRHPFLYVCLMNALLIIGILSFINLTSYCTRVYMNQSEYKKQWAEQVKFQILIDEIKCRESGGHHDGVWGDGGKSYGECQWQEHSFNKYKRMYGMLKADWKDRYDQTMLMIRTIKEGHGHEWTTYRAAYIKVYGHNPPPRGVKLMEA